MRPPYSWLLQPPSQPLMPPRQQPLLPLMPGMPHARPHLQPWPQRQPPMLQRQLRHAGYQPAMTAMKDPLKAVGSRVGGRL